MNKVLKPLKVGPYNIDPPLFLAPMAGVTDRPFRQLCKQLGAGLATSEMVNVNSLLYGSEKTLRRANHTGESKPCSVQIAGGKPEMMARAAIFNQEHGADVIDINMGCPAKKVCNTIAGSALLRDEKLVADILRAVVDAVDIPVTLKIRTGWSKQNKNGITIAKIAEDNGIQALAVHGRTKECLYKGHAEYETIAAIKQAVRIPVIANGDITTPEEAKYVLEMTNADGLMIGRAAQGRPWIFREIAHYLNTGEKLLEITNHEICTLMLDHLKNLYKFYGEERGVKIARKHVGWYSKGQHSGSNFRRDFNLLESSDAQLVAIKDFFTTFKGNG